MRENPFTAFEQNIAKAKGAAARDEYDEARAYAEIAAAYAQMGAAFNLQGVQQAIQSKG